MKTLPVRPLPISAEPLVDYLERLANANGYNLREFMSALNGADGITPEALTSVLNGHTLPKFSGPAVQSASIEVDTFGLQAVDFTHMNRRWCPSCIVQAGWMRPIWRLKVATICVVHRTRLVQACSQCRYSPSLQEMLHGACKCGHRFVETSIQATRTELQIAHALSDSLNGAVTLNLGETDVKLLTPQLVRLICYTGQFVKGPLLRRPGKIRELEDISVAAGLVAGTAKLLADWPSAFWSCLESFVDVAPADASVRRVFGALYHVLYQDLRDPSFQFLRDAFELFLLEHWRGELCGRHRLFNHQTIQDHRHQGLARVARASGIGSKTLRRMVHQDRFPANHFDPASKRQLITINKEELARILPDQAAYIDLRSTARLLGLKRSRLRQLIAHGAILADAKPDFARSNHWHLQRSEVFGLLEDLRRGSVGVSVDAGVVTLNHALRYWRVSAAELGALIRTVRQQGIQYGLAVADRLSDMRFRKSDLQVWLRDARASTTTWVSISRAAELLGLKEQVVYELVARNFLIADVITKGGHAVRRIALPSLQQFEETYVAVSVLAKQRNTSSRSLLQQVASRPVTGPDIDGARQYFFRRADLAAETQETING